MKKTFILSAAALSLAACGGSETTSIGDDIILPVGPPGYRALAEEAVALIDKGNLYLSGPFDPPSSDATFNGIMIASDTSGALPGDYVGDFSATYTFSTQTIDGQASGFFYDPNENPNVAGTGTAVAGTVTADGTVGLGGLVDVTLGGTLDGASVDGTGLGTFAGPGGDMFVIVAEGVNAVGRTTMDFTVLSD